MDMIIHKTGPKGTRLGGGQEVRCKIGNLFVRWGGKDLKKKGLRGILKELGRWGFPKTGNRKKWE